MERERESGKSNSEKCIHGDTAQVGISFSSCKQRLIWLSEMNEFQRVDCTRVQHTPHSNIFCIILHNFFFLSLLRFRKKSRYGSFIEIQINFCQLVKSREAYCSYDLFSLNTYSEIRSKDTRNRYKCIKLIWFFFNSFISRVLNICFVFYYRIFTRNEFHAI